MKHVVKGIITGVLCVSILSSGSVKAETVNQAESTSSDGIVTAEVSISKEEVMNNVTRALLGGEVVGNGVRLREKASTSATVLELMYDGEAVKVNTLETVKKNGIRWYYVKRVKTGTWGYADSEFIFY